MPSPASLLILATLLPLISFGLLLFAGKRIGSPLAGVVGTAFIAASFVCSIGAMIGWLNVTPASTWGAGKGPIHLPLQWLPVGGGGVDQDRPGYVDVGVYDDSGAVAMFAMITILAAAVYVSTIAYMRHSSR